MSVQRLLPVILLAALLVACGGGGGGNTRVDPPPAGPPPTTPPPTGLDFTPNVPNDASLTRPNAPEVPAQGGPASLPQYSQHLQLINAAGALGAGLTGRGVGIGLLDSGVNRNHPALNGRVMRHFIHVGSGNDLSVDDRVGHGTVVAQIAAGRQVGNWGGGVAQGASIYSSRIISDRPPVDDGSGGGNEIRAGQGYGEFFRQVNAQLADAGARIINNSWGGLYWNDPRLTTELVGAWRDFVVNRGGMIVFANGNSGRDPRHAGNPSDNAMLPSLANDRQLERGWLTVGALDPDNPTQLTDYSQQCGAAMNYCLVAPGNVIFIDPAAQAGASSYDLYRGGGTSYAAPQVAGAAAIVWEAFPYFDNDLVRQTLLGGARDLGAPGVDPVFGWGLLDVSRAANGPSNFAWGDVRVSFTGHSVWRNPIVGTGGLIKEGTGVLTLTDRPSYTGDTRVLGGGLSLRNGLGFPDRRSNVFIGTAGTLWANGFIYGNVDNQGGLLSDAAFPLTIRGDFTQGPNGNLGVWLSNMHASVSGRANLDGRISILGVRQGYTTSSRETLLAAEGGINGRFATLQAAPNVFLDASLAYDANNVFLDIRRVDVSRAIAGMGLSAVAVKSAQRVERAMQAIDAQIAGNGPIGISSDFIEGAGALQQVVSAAQADRAVRSLSGEAHATAQALTLEMIGMQRRSLSARVDGLTQGRGARSSWQQTMAAPGQGGLGLGRFQAEGWMLGHDALSNGVVAGFAFGELHADFGLHQERAQMRQTQAQAYLARGGDRGYALVRFGGGRYERQMQRMLFLGERRDDIATGYAGHFFDSGIEAGYRVGAAGFALTPYLAADYVALRRDGFIESGANGFGLKASASDAERLQGIAGLRSSRTLSKAMRLQGYVEWQRTLSGRGLMMDASFVGAESWSPILGEHDARSGGLFGLSLDAELSPRTALSFGFDQRFGPRGDERMASLRYAFGF